MSITTGVLVFVVLVFTANHHAVVSHVFRRIHILHVNTTYLLEGFLVNIKLFVVRRGGDPCLVADRGGDPGTCRGHQRRRCARSRGIYTDIFRGLPALLVILIVRLGLRRTGLLRRIGPLGFRRRLLALTLCSGPISPKSSGPVCIASIEPGSCRSLAWPVLCADAEAGCPPRKRFATCFRLC